MVDKGSLLGKVAEMNNEEKKVTQKLRQKIRLLRADALADSNVANAKIIAYDAVLVELTMQGHKDD